MDTLKKQLNAECSYRMRDETMDMFLAAMSVVELRAGEPLIDYGALDSNIYILKNGIVRVAYFNGFKELTWAFGTPGTMMGSYYPFYKHEPSFFRFEACCDSVFMKISKPGFVELTRRSHDFAQWVMWMSVEQLWLNEKKLAIVNGDAKERFEALMKNRPEIMEKVSAKVIASYIGITPQYLSYLKRNFSSSRGEVSTDRDDFSSDPDEKR
ncbi:MAG: Crp/Fnr family transcriptional regulator [Alistipes sp.]|jgi:CRP-like cAMP-binding protein|nr:Crp/Fnr family transcriptional regulator [Alistipes sp.]